MKLRDIENKYGVDKLDQLYDLLISCPQSQLLEELLEFYSEDTIADLMSNFDGDNEEADYDNSWTDRRTSSFR